MKKQRRLIAQQELDGQPLDFDWMEPKKPTDSGSDHDYESIPDEINRESKSSAPPPLFSEINAVAESVIRNVQKLTLNSY